MYEAWHQLQDEAIAACPPYPSDRFSGRGIVICAGGARLFTCAWVLLRLLRDLGCKLPVEVWHLGAAEMDWRMSRLLEELGAAIIDAWRDTSPDEKPAQGWVLKPYAILHSRFREVLLIDADNTAVVDPEYLFDMPEYLATGAVFWPDLEPIPRNSAIWEICGVDYVEEPSFESGQVLIDKQKCWAALQLTNHLNRHADFYYQHVHGDKDTFHMAWRMLEQSFSMIPHPPGELRAVVERILDYRGPVLAQHDFEGRRVFQHRNLPKWVAWGRNPVYPEFQYEHECLGYLQELRDRWDGHVTTAMPAPPRVRQSEESAWFIYEHVGSGVRCLELQSDGQTGSGGSENERSWRITDFNGDRVLELRGDRVNCRLSQVSPGEWRGAWLHHEYMPVALTRWKSPPLKSVNLYGSFRGFTGHDHHVREFARELDRREVEVGLLDMRQWSPAKLPEDCLDPWFAERGAKRVDGPMAQFCMPHQTVRWPDRTALNFTMFEASRVPARWIELSRNCDLTVVPSESSRRAWLTAGMSADHMRICPLGVDPVAFGIAIPPRDLPGRHYRTRFLNISAYGPRKNLEGLLRVWKKATSERDDAVLLLKVGCHDTGTRESWARDLAEAAGAAPIRLIDDVLSDPQMPGLYAAATHYISLSHGEGWDLPMMEAGAAGLRLIAPAHSAYLAYLDDDVATLLPSRETPVVWTGDAATGELFRGANWWEPDEDAAVAAIRAAIDGSERQTSARERILEDFTWQKAAGTLLEILGGLESRRNRRWFSWRPRRNKGASAD